MVGNILKYGLIAGGSLAALLGIRKVVQIAKVKNAVDKLNFDITALKLKKLIKNGALPEGVILTVDVQFANPTNESLVFSQPYINISLKDSTGQYTRIANTNEPSKDEVTIAAESKVKKSFDIEARFQNIASEVPDFFKYIMGRIVMHQPATKDALIDMTVDSMGQTIPVQTTVKI